MSTSIAYTVGVRRRFGIFFRKYSVWGHTLQQLGETTRLNLKMSDGSVLCVPEIHRKFFKVYPDYSIAKSMIDKMKEGIRQPQASPSPVIEDLRDGISEG